MSQKLEAPEIRMCSQCNRNFMTSWSQNICNKCKRDRAASAWTHCKECNKQCAVGSNLCWDCFSGKDIESKLYDIEDVSWVAGYLDAEGSFVKRGLKNRLNVVATSTDLDVLQKIEQKVSGIVRGPYYRKDISHKPYFRWEEQHEKLAEDLAIKIYPYLSKRKQNQIAASKIKLPKIFTNLPVREIAWLAGYLEGDGYFDSRRVVTADSIDIDLLEKIQEKFGGTINHYSPRSPKHNVIYRWYLNSHDSVSLMKEILPFMGLRRAERILSLLK